jgi:hypothetical protein
VARLVAEHPVAYYTTTNSAHYPGAVALLNSLRLLGEDAPLFVLDCGLTDRQRASLSQHAELVAADATKHPGLQKTVAPLAHPAEIMIVVDADVIVNRALTPLFAEAMSGNVVAVTDANADRFFPEWSELGLGTPVRRKYVNAGHFILSVDTAVTLLPLFERLQAELVISGSAYEPTLLSDASTHPYFHADQDVFNAMLCTSFEGRVTRLNDDAWAVPPFRGLRLTGRTDTFAEYSDGTAPFFLHHLGRKPWTGAVRSTMFSELFTELVTDDAAPIRLGRADLPLRLSRSRFARVDRWRASMQHAAHRNLRGRLHIRPAIARARARMAASRLSSNEAAAP